MRPAQGRILWVLALMSTLLIFGTLGFHWVEGWSLFDGFYMTLMTLTTVGFGEIQQRRRERLRGALCPSA